MGGWVPAMNKNSADRPIVGLTCCIRDINGMMFHAVGDKYVQAVAVGADAIPLNIPAMGREADLDAILNRLDGLVVTGSPSNVEPQHYGGPAFPAETLRDPARDATSLPLIEKALARGMPLLAICRGIQELNVVLGGTLHQNIAAVEGRDNHFAPTHLPIDVRFDLAHEVHVRPGGYLAALLGKEQFTINSIHGQGIDVPGRNLEIEAVAPDGQIEAVRVTGVPGFALGIQWHPEHASATDPHSAAIFAGFGRVLRGGSFHGKTGDGESANPEPGVTPPVAAAR